MERPKSNCPSFDRSLDGIQVHFISDRSGKQTVITDYYLVVAEDWQWDV
jgi:hypothetical protein